MQELERSKAESALCLARNLIYQLERALLDTPPGKARNQTVWVLAREDQRAAEYADALSEP